MPIASTQMTHKGDEVTISIYKPALAFPDSDQYSCRFSIAGGGLDYSGKSIGFDSMQSLILSMSKIGTYLKNNDDIDHSMIEWEGGPMEFPTFQNI
jgi:hypothetical protein